MPVEAKRSIKQIDSADVIIIPSILVQRGEWEQGRYPELVKWLAEMHAAGAQLCSTCSGVLLLAETGLLDGKDATVHWMYAPTFRRNFPNVAAAAGQGAGRRRKTSGVSQKAGLAADNLTAYVGPENGYVLTFTNGLVVYLSGDTGHTGDMATIVNDYYKADLAVMHMGDIFSMGPEEAAFAVKRLIKPKSVIAEHANEAATTNGIVQPGGRTARFIDLVKGTPVHVPLSGVTMQFDRNGKCASGC